MKKFSFLPVAVILVLIAIGVSNEFFFTAPTQPTSEGEPSTPSTFDAAAWEESLIPVESFDHSHGLALDPNNPSRLYIATHEGLYVLIDETDLYAIGRAEDDYMGFSAHPTLPGVFFTSGHPRTGGNLGVQQSIDGGVTWEKISNGANGPVDFHAMAISPVNPDLLYGWYGEKLQRSTDGGESWDVFESDLFGVMLFVAHPTDAEVVYAMTFAGPFVSRDRGETWNFLLELEGGKIIQMTSLAIDPKNPDWMISYSSAWGLAVSEDAGTTWVPFEEDLNGEAVLFFAISPQDSNVVYALTNQNHLYKTADKGVSWTSLF